MTDTSESIIKLHEKLDQTIYQRYLDDLQELSDAEIQTYLKVQKALNQEFFKDLQESF